MTNWTAAPVTIWVDLSKPSSTRDLTHDLNGEGQVNEEDLDIVKRQYRSRALLLNRSNRGHQPGDLTLLSQ